MPIYQPRSMDNNIVIVFIFGQIQIQYRVRQERKENTKEYNKEKAKDNIPVNNKSIPITFTIVVFKIETEIESRHYNIKQDS